MLLISLLNRILSSVKLASKGGAWAPKALSLRTSVNMSSGSSSPFASLWLQLPQLESFHLIDSIVLATENFDAEFLGIHDEEVERLRQEDDETLEKIHIVPIRPSVLTMTRKPSKTCTFSPPEIIHFWLVNCLWTGLKSLEIELEGEDELVDDIDDVAPGQSFLSRLTGILAFKKMSQMGIGVKLVCRNPTVGPCKSGWAWFVIENFIWRNRFSWSDVFRRS